MGSAGILRSGFNALVYVALALPTIVVVGASLNTSSALAFPPEGLSLKWYWAAFGDIAFMRALWLSVYLAAASTFLSLAIGSPAAYAIARYAFRGKELAQSTLMSPLIVPAVVLAIGLLSFLNWLGIGRTFTGLLIAHVLVTLPYVVRTMTAAFALYDPVLEQAAQNLRAGPWQVAWRVTLPILLPGILSSAIFAFITSFGNVTVSIFLTTLGKPTLPVQIFAYVDQSLDPIVAAVSTIVIVVTLLLIFLVERAAGLQRLV